MTVVRNSAMEEMAGRLAELEAEVQSYADELAEVIQERDALIQERTEAFDALILQIDDEIAGLRQENEALRIEIKRLVGDPSMTV